MSAAGAGPSGSATRVEQLGGPAARTLTSVLLFLIPTALGAFLALHQIGQPSFWRDEVWSVSIAERSLAGSWEVLVNREANMGPYYLLLNGWIRLGTGEGFVRAFSALFAIAAIPVTMLFARRAFGDLAAGLAGIALATNAFFVAYAQEARGYTLVLLLAALSSLLLLRAIDGGGSREWLLYSLTAGVMIYSHFLSGLIVVAQLGSLVFLPASSVPWREVRRSLLGLTVLCVPIVLFALFRDRGQSAWIPETDLERLRDFGNAYTGSRALAAIYVILFFVALGQLVLELRRSGRGRPAWTRGMVVLWAVLPPALLVVVSIVKPLFVDRFLIGILPGMAVLAGAAISTLRPARAAVLGAVLLAAASLADVLSRQHPPSKLEDLRAAAALVSKRQLPGDGIAYAPSWARVGFSYYLDRVARSGRSSLPDLAIRQGRTPLRQGDVFAAEASPRTVARRLLGRKRVWLVGYPGSDWHPAPDPVSKVGAELFPRYFVRQGAWSFGQISVRLLRRVTGRDRAHHPAGVAQRGLRAAAAR